MMSEARRRMLEQVNEASPEREPCAECAGPGSNCSNCGGEGYIGDPGDEA